MRRQIIVMLFVFSSLAGFGQTFEWAKKAGGKSNDVSNSIRVDGSGIYITGSFKGNALFDSATITSAGEEDIFIAKYSDSASLQWVRSAGGKGEDVANAIDIDASGNLFIAGYFNGTVSFEDTTLSSSGADFFLAKYDASGTFKWVKKAGGAGNDYAYSLSIDASGNIYVTGDFSDTAYFDNHALSSNGSKDVFLVKYDSAGVVQWARKAGGAKADAGNNVYADNAGNIYLTGDFSDSASFESAKLMSYGESDIFLAKYSASGNLIWVKKAGGKNNDSGNGIRMDALGSVYVTGNFRNISYFGDTTISAVGGSDVFLAKYSADGVLLWIEQAGGKENEESNGICIDENANIYITGNFKNTMRFKRMDIYSDEGTDVFIAKYNSQGDIEWTKRAGGLSNDLSQSIDVDRTGNIYITGVFKELARFGKVKLFNINETGTSDVFIAKIIQKKICKCEHGKNVIKTQPINYIFEYKRFSYERVIDSRSSFELEFGFLTQQIDYFGDTLDEVGHLSTWNYNVILEYRRYANEVLRGFYYAPFVRLKKGDNEFSATGANGADVRKYYYTEKSFSAGLGLVGGYQYIFRNCISLDAFIGGYAKVGYTYNREYAAADITEEKMKMEFKGYESFKKENAGLGFRFGLKIGYTF